MGLFAALITLLLALAAPTIHAANGSEQLIEQLRQHAIIEGRFEQTRQLQGLSRPLISSGSFIFWRRHGLYWETLTPFYQATTFTDKELINWLSPQGPAEPASTDDPVQKHVSRILLAVFSTDMSTIDKLFNSNWATDDHGWSLELTPANAAVSKLIEHVRLRGDQHLRQLQVASANGDVSTMRFDQIVAPARLEPSRCSRFDRRGTLRCPDADTTSTPLKSRLE